MRRLVQAIVVLLFLQVTLARSSFANGTAAPLDPKLCAPPAATAQTPPDKKNKRKARAAIETARVAYDKGDFAASITALQEAYALDPLVDLLYNIAQACREAGLQREALTLYESVLKQNPTTEQKEASERKITELRPKVAEAEDKLASKALEGKQYTEASEGWKRAYQVNPLPIYLFRMAETQRLAGRNDEAIASYDQFLSRKPSGDSARDAARHVGQLRAQKEDEKASAHFEKEEYIQATMSWDSAYKLDARPIYIFRKAEALYKANQTQEAINEYQRFLKAGPSEERELRQQAEARVAELKSGDGPSLQSPSEKTKKPVYKRWWFWVALGGGAVTAVAIGVAIGRGPIDPLGTVPMQNVRMITP